MEPEKTPEVVDAEVIGTEDATAEVQDPERKDEGEPTPEELQVKADEAKCD